MISHFILCAVALVFVTFINAAATHFRGRFVAKSSEGMAKTLRDDLYWHLQAVPYDYHKHVSTGDLIQRCTSDVETIRRFVANQLLEMLRTLVMLIVATAIMFSLDAKMALLSTMLLPFLVLLRLFISGRYAGSLLFPMNQKACYPPRFRKI